MLRHLPTSPTALYVNVFIAGGNDFAISELDNDDIDNGKGRCFEPEPIHLPMGKPSEQKPFVGLLVI